MRQVLHPKPLAFLCVAALVSCSKPKKEFVRVDPKLDAGCTLGENWMDVSYKGENRHIEFSDGEGIRRQFNPMVLSCTPGVPITIFNPETNAIIVLPAPEELMVREENQISIKRIRVEEK